MTIPTDGLHGCADLRGRVVPDIAPDDSMMRGNAGHYFRCGANAMALVRDAVALAGVPAPRAVLDYACGYGRVLRWLAAAYPDARILGVDVQADAVASARRTLGVETRAVAPSMEARLGDPFDLAWVGSLVTHLDRPQVLALLRFLASHLSRRGVLVFTTHGPFVRDRIAGGTADYGLDEAGRAALVEGYGRGYGFASYPRREGYGISASPPATVLSLVEEAGMRPILFRSRGWDGHQDAFGAVAQG